MRFKASQWKDGTWMVMYHVCSISGVQKTITGELVDVGEYARSMWSGIRGLSDMTQESAERVADILNTQEWVWDCGARGGTLRSPTGDILGGFHDHKVTQPGDDYWLPRTVQADASGSTEFFNKADDAKLWATAYAAYGLYVLGIEGFHLPPRALATV